MNRALEVVRFEEVTFIVTGKEVVEMRFFLERETFFERWREILDFGVITFGNILH